MADKWSTKDPKLTDGVEDPLGETLTFDRLPRAHHKHLKSTNMLERLNEEIKLNMDLLKEQRRECLPAAA